MAASLEIRFLGGKFILLSGDRIGNRLNFAPSLHIRRRRVLGKHGPKKREQRVICLHGF